MMRHIILTAAITSALAAAAYGQFELTSSTLDGGGGRSTGGEFELSCTIGQPDASVIVMTGGEFELTGGFWPGAAGGAVPADDDGDGVPNADDLCPGTNGGSPVDENGCACEQLDDDADGVNNCLDLCPGTPPDTQVDADGCEIITPQCDGDANGDDTVDPLDSGYVQARFGCEVSAGDPACDSADVNLDGFVDPLDVGYVLARFGACP